MRTKIPTPTAGPIRVANNIITNDLVAITLYPAERTAFIFQVRFTVTSAATRKALSGRRIRREPSGAASIGLHG